MRAHRKLATWVLFAFGIVTILATGSPKPPESGPPNYIELVQKSTPACTCTNSKGWFIKNRDTRSRSVSYRWTRRDTIGNSTITDTDSKIAAGQADTFLSCSIEGGPLGCTTEWQYALRSHTVTTSNAALVGFGVGEREQSLEICKALCASGSPECFSMGPAFAKVTRPLLQLYSDAVGNRKDTVSKTDILKAYGLSQSDDGCERTDLQLKNSGREFSNDASSGQACEVKAFDLLSAFSGLLTANDKEELANLTLWMRPTIKGEVKRVLTSSGEADMLWLPENKHGLNLQFTGPNGDATTDAYGSEILAMQQVNKLLVMQTANGCISSPVP